MANKTKIDSSRIKQIMRRANNPKEMLFKTGKENIIHCYQNDVDDLIIYIRFLEEKLGLDSVYLHKRFL